MARRTRRHFYAIRARHHEAAARSARTSTDREGHHEIASGYHKLARGARARGEEIEHRGRRRRKKARKTTTRRRRTGRRRSRR